MATVLRRYNASTTAWEDVASTVVVSGSGGSGGVTSVNTRTGAVTGLAEDSTVVHLAGAETITGAKTFSTAPSVVALAVSGLTGATTATRFVGGVTSAAPASGTFTAGDFVVATTGTIFICTTGGTPGTWTQVTAAGGGGSTANMVTTDTSQTITGTKTFTSSGTGFYSGAAATNNLNQLNFGRAAGAPDMIFGAANATNNFYTGVTAGDAAIRAETGKLHLGVVTTGTAGLVLSGTATTSNQNLYEGANRVYSAGNAPPAPSNMVTTDTAQDLAAGKRILVTPGASGLVLGVATSQQATVDNPFVASPFLNFTTSYWNGTSPAGDGIYVNGIRRSAVAGELTLGVSSGLTVSMGSRQPSTFMGGNTTGAPASGTYRAGDFVVTQDGHVWVCRSAGTPGVWTDVGAVPSNMVTTDTAQDLSAGKRFFGAPGSSPLQLQQSVPASSTTTSIDSPSLLFQSAFWNGTYSAGDGLYVNALRRSATSGDHVLRVQAGLVAAVPGATSPAGFMGGTAGSGPPTSGSFRANDFVIAQNGRVWVCTSGGTPGSWVDAGAVDDGTVTTAKIASGGIAESAVTGLVVDLAAKYSASNVPPAPTNMVTTDGTQTISGVKTVTAPVMAFINAAAADATTTTRSSPTLYLETQYWTGTTSSTEIISLQAIKNSTTPGDSYLNVVGSLRATSVYDSGSRVYSVNNKVPVAGISTTSGTASASTYLRGDGTWATPAAGSSLTVTSQTAAYTAVNGNIVLANGTFTVTLPTATANAQVTVKNTGTGTITIGGTVDGSTTTVLGTQYQSITVVSDGSAWFGI